MNLVFIKKSYEGNKVYTHSKIIKIYEIFIEELNTWELGTSFF